jgi:hypothetical protein
MMNYGGYIFTEGRLMKKIWGVVVLSMQILVIIGMEPKLVQLSALVSAAETRKKDLPVGVVQSQSMSIKKSGLSCTKHNNSPDYSLENQYYRVFASDNSSLSRSPSPKDIYLAHYYSLQHPTQ